MLNNIKEERIKKLALLKKNGAIVFPIEVSRDLALSGLILDFTKLSKRKKPFSLAGRILAIRSHGGSVFCDFTDGTAKLQAFLKKDILDEQLFNLFNDTVDIGDFVEWKGKLFLTKKKEKTLEVSSWRMISKSLRPLPEKWHGFSDVDERFRKRYLDILMNEDVKNKFIFRSRLVSEIRNFFDELDFVEVETPILHSLAGGALAEPFKTHQNSLDIDLYLRIAPELYLKRLLIAGFPKIYELGKQFRNEGIDVSHNPEFTMLEFYEAYKDSVYAREIVELLICKLTKKLFGKEILEYGEYKVTLNKKFAIINFYDVLERYSLISNPQSAPKEELVLKAKQFGIDVSIENSKWKIADSIFKKICRPKIIQPTFVVNYPIESSPLAKQLNDKPLLDRFQLVVAGLEIANGFSELNDPIEQTERFAMQDKLAAAGEKEVSPSDEEFLEAMEYGMPPAVGCGIGIDRLAMLFTNTHNIKEIIIFPTMRPK